MVHILKFLFKILFILFFMAILWVIITKVLQISAVVRFIEYLKTVEFIQSLM
jgi:hypothetical protein